MVRFGATSKPLNRHKATYIRIYISIRCSLSSLDVSVLVSSLSVWLACPFPTNVRASCDFGTTSCAVAVSVCVCGCWDWLCMCCRALWWFLMIKGRRKIYALSLVTTNQIPVGVSHIHAHSMRFHRAQLSSTHRTALALHTFCIFVADLRYVFFFFLLFPIAIYSHFVRKERERCTANIQGMDVCVVAYGVRARSQHFSIRLGNSDNKIDR